MERAITRPTLPKFFPELAALSVSRRPVFPGFYKTLSIKDQGLIEALQERLSGGKVYLGLFLRRNDPLGLEAGPLSSNDAEKSPLVFSSPEEIHEVGVVSQLINIIPSGKDSATAVLYPHRRVQLERMVIPTVPTHDSSSESDHSAAQLYPLVQARTLLDDPVDVKGQVFKALSQEIFVVLADIAKLNPFFREHITHHNVSSAVFDDPARLADFVAVLCTGDPAELQEILADRDVESRIRRALTILKKELQTAQLQSTISRDIEQKIGQKQKEFFLHEQLKAIKKELGLESDAKEKLMAQYRKARESLALPEATAVAFDEEIARLNTLDPASSEFSLCRNYLDWLSQLPWGKTTDDILDVSRAREILDRTHAGMDDVKDRIVEFVAVSKLKQQRSDATADADTAAVAKNGGSKGKILCFVGPPGVGKTSIGVAIAEALGRQFYRFSVGGLSDVAEIKGHRRTYVGAMPGKLLQALKRVRSCNPVILIDEVDKIGRGGLHGDPTSALLEVLDPEQNASFADHYLDVPFDLSRVLFICTANVLETIPAPLLDRMEVISLSGYTSEEKVDIAKRFLLPSILKDNGMADSDILISDDALWAVQKGYCREAGVRSFRGALDRVVRKIAVEKAHQPTGRALRAVEEKDLESLLGPVVFRNERIHVEEILPPGLSTGLAWTAAGGSILYIETISESASYSKAAKAAFSPSFRYTGQMGKVMEESCQIALSYAKAHMRGRSESVKKNNDFFATHSLHLHVPEGAVPKDGPSAGIAMAVSLLTAALGQGLPSNLALTGELTLTGKVLPVGGIREKVAAAKRAAVTTVVLPKANAADWQKLPEYIKTGMTVHLVEDFEEVARVCGLSN